jgi:protein SCO1/2
MSKVSSARNSGRGKTSKSSKGPNVPKLPIIVIGVGFAALFAAMVAFTSSKPIAPASASVGGPFQLTAHNGQMLTDKDLLGRPFLVFFGYTHCPDVCHTTLFEMSEILRALGPKAKIGALFVTVDPERDTPAVLKDYLSNFDPRIVGLSGDHAALDPMLSEYRIYAKKAPGETEDYAVDHTTVVYLMDKNGRFVSAFNVTRRPGDAARDLERYL